MEKYGVEQVSIKQAQVGSPDECPSCGGKVETKGNVRWCSACGTEPFEEEKNGEEEGGGSTD